MALGSLSWLSWPADPSISMTTRVQRQASNTTIIHAHDVIDDESPPPLQAWRLYVQQHGPAALAADSPAQRAARTYLVAPYWCPDRAGNVLHNLWNSLTWAVLLNRTALLTWVPGNPNGNSPADCAAVLPTRPDQIALWEDWQSVLDVNEVDVQSIPLQVSRWRYDASLRVVLVPQIPDVYHTTDTLSRNGWDDHPLAASQPAYRAYLQDIWRAAATNENDDDDSLQRQAAQLFSWGVPFLYGLLFRHVFVLPAAEDLRQADTHGTAIAVHSRHVAAGDDGSWVPEEMACLTKLLVESPLSAPCSVTLLSDRRASLRLLTDWVATHAPHCVVNVPPDESHTVDTTRVREHGPFAGAGFLHDLSRATAGPPLTALVGDPHRSSFRLLYELAVYDKFRALTTAPNVTLDPSTVDLPVCVLARKTARGYTYGPGTPLFVRNQEHFPPLATTRVLDDYRATILTPAEPRFLVVDLVCPSQPNYSAFLAALIFAILSERTLLWRPTSTNPVDCQVQDWLPSWDETSSRYGLNLTHAVEFADPTSPQSQLVTLSPPSLEALTSTLLRGTYLRPNQGGGRRKMAEALYTYGPDFLFGMLLQEVFVEVLPRRVPKLDPSAWTVGLDIRGTRLSDNTDNIPHACLDLVLGNRTTAECQMVILGDEQTSAQSLQKEIEEKYNCSFVEVKESQPERVLAVARLVRHGWITIGTEKDALSSRIRQRIEWERVQETWMLGRFPIEVSPFQDCPSDPFHQGAF
jgi:hypothetical protein